jgi:hypothetical protein
MRLELASMTSGLPNWPSRSSAAVEFIILCVGISSVLK